TSTSHRERHRHHAHRPLPKFDDLKLGLATDRRFFGHRGLRSLGSRGDRLDASAAVGTRSAVATEDSTEQAEGGRQISMKTGEKRRPPPQSASLRRQRPAAAELLAARDQSAWQPDKRPTKIKALQFIEARDIAQLTGRGGKDCGSGPLHQRLRCMGRYARVESAEAAELPLGQAVQSASGVWSAPVLGSSAPGSGGQDSGNFDSKVCNKQSDETNNANCSSSKKKASLAETEAEEVLAEVRAASGTARSPLKASAQEQGSSKQQEQPAAASRSRSSQLQKQLLPKLQKRQGKQQEAAHSSDQSPASQEQQQEKPEQKQIPLQQTAKQSSPKRKQKAAGKIATGRLCSRLSQQHRIIHNLCQNQPQPNWGARTPVPPARLSLWRRSSLHCRVEGGPPRPLARSVQGDSGKQAEYNAEAIDDRPDPRQASNPLPSTPKEAEAEADNLDIGSGSNVDVFRVPVMPSEPGEADDRDDVAIEEEEEEAAAQDDVAPVNLSRVSLTFHPRH
uniref:PHD-type domain-containing protein n=1 Tax=Macrostomum lignano TaxID=282301 RepID=A0A1I8JSA5_9PLAT